MLFKTYDCAVVDSVSLIVNRSYAEKGAYFRISEGERNARVWVNPKDVKRIRKQLKEILKEVEHG